MKKKVCIVTGTRAEYGLLKPLIRQIGNDINFELQLVVTGMHLSSEFGFTLDEISNDGFVIDAKVEILLSSDTPVGVTKSMGLGLISFADTFEVLKPDVVLVLGDRFEIFSASVAAHVARIPVAHLHGGELTEGAFDDAFRHSITKMSHMHFVAHEKYRNRVIQLGESPESTFLVGGLSIDSLNSLALLSKEDLEKQLNFKFRKRNLLVTFHPVSLENKTAFNQVTELLGALEGLQDTGIIFTMPNADGGHFSIAKLINNFVLKNDNSQAYASLGQTLYYSCIAHVDGVVGNSSSGLLEVPSFRKGTINIGDRQRGRIQSSSVINCEPLRIEISKALEKLYSPEFQANLQYVENPYGSGGATEKIISALKATNFPINIKKVFYDLP